MHLKNAKVDLVIVGWNMSASTGPRARGEEPGACEKCLSQFALSRLLVYIFISRFTQDLPSAAVQSLVLIVG